MKIDEAVMLIKLFNNAEELSGVVCLDRNDYDRLSAFKSLFWRTCGYMDDAIARAIHEAGGMAGAW